MDRKRHDDTHHGWISSRHMKHFYYMQTLNLCIIYAAVIVSKLVFTDFDHEFYICMASLILVAIANACYRVLDPVAKKIYDGNKYAVGEPEEHETKE